VITAALAALRDTGRAWLKLVIGASSDADEAEALARRLEWPRDRILWMPLAATRDELVLVSPLVSALALARKIRVSPRLHVEKWGGRRGV